MGGECLQKGLPRATIRGVFPGFHEVRLFSQRPVYGGDVQEGWCR
jgi:hypothetical protein